MQNNKNKDITYHLSPLLKQSTDIIVDRADGVYLWDEDGTRYMDFTSGIGVLSTGHCHPKVIEAAIDQSKRIVHAQYRIVKHRPILDLSTRICELLPESIDSVFFANTGTEVIEAAIRLARQSTKKTNIIAFRGGFHGRTMGALSATTTSASVRQGVQRQLGDVVIAPFPDTNWYKMTENEAADFCLRELDYILQSHSLPNETAAMLIEPIQGEAGYITSSERFMQGIKARCKKYNILLIIDEVQTGNGRTGKMWGFEHYGVTPDIVVSAKGIASGFQLSFMAASKNLMKNAQGSQGSTYGGNAVACAAALATLDIIRDEKLIENAEKIGNISKEKLSSLQSKYPEINAITGKGLMLGIHIIDSKRRPDSNKVADIIKLLEKKGLLLISAGIWGNVIRWIPPLIVTEEEIDWAIQKFDEALYEIKQAHSS